MALTTRSIQGESLSAAADRYVNTLLLREGVLDTAKNGGVGSFAVRAQSTPNMTVRVGSGVAYDMAVVEGDTAGMGNFIVENDATTENLNIAAADATNDRYDLVYLLVEEDTFDSSGNDQASLNVATGTPGENEGQAIDDLPDNALLLATVFVEANATEIETGDITDYRYECPVRGTLHTTLYVNQADSPYTFTKADPLAFGNSFGDVASQWLHHVVVKVQGAGGGGGGAVATGGAAVAFGEGGGGGAYAEAKVIFNDLGTTETATVGAGGSGNSAANGSAGGDSSFGSHAVAGGGPGGAETTETGVMGGIDGAAGGTATAGDLQIDGGPGGAAWGDDDTFNRAIAYGGGDSHLGHGGRGTNMDDATANGGNGSAYGGGGGGSHNHRSQSAATGGDGADGIIIIELYA